MKKHINITIEKNTWLILNLKMLLKLPNYSLLDNTLNSISTNYTRYVKSKYEQFIFSRYHKIMNFM